MPLFKYVAKTAAGETDQGVLDAPNEDEAVSILQGRDLTVTSLTPATQEAAQQAAAPGDEEEEVAAPTKKVAKRGKASNQDLIAFSRSVATMMEAGLPLLRSLEAIGPQIQSRSLQSAIEEIANDLKGGSTFKDAIGKYPKIFNTLWISLIETGEASGQLPNALQQIASHLEKSGAIQRKVVSAMVYPMILILVAVVAILVFVLKIIPTFGNLFEGFGVELPWLTQSILDISFVVRKYFLVGIVTIVVGSIAFLRYSKTKVGKWTIDGFLLRLPVVNELVQGTSVASFADGLGTLIKAGVPILHGLEIAIASTPNSHFAHVIEQMRAGAREGRPLAEPLKESDLFPPMVTQMIAVGEETGKLAAMLDEIAKYYDDQVTTIVERLTALVEPVLLIGMGSIIGVLLLAMYLPIFQMSQIAK